MIRPRLGGFTVLLLEDEPLVALDVVDALKAAGAQVHVASTISSALLHVEEICPSAAILDISIGGQDCAPVCRLLSDRAIPFAFYTGYSTADALTSWPHAPVLRKPARNRDLVDLARALSASSREQAHRPAQHAVLTSS